MQSMTIFINELILEGDARKSESHRFYVRVILMYQINYSIQDCAEDTHRDAIGSVNFGFRRSSQQQSE